MNEYTTTNSNGGKEFFVFIKESEHFNSSIHRRSNTACLYLQWQSYHNISDIINL